MRIVGRSPKKVPPSSTTAHAPKIIWIISEDDALDPLSTISLIQRKLEIK